MIDDVTKLVRIVKIVLLADVSEQVVMFLHSEVSCGHDVVDDTEWLLTR